MYNTEDYVSNSLNAFDNEVKNADFYYPFSKDLIIDIMQKELILPKAE